MLSRTRDGTVISPSPGSSITMIPMRANTSMKVAANAGRNEISIRMTALSALILRAFQSALADWNASRDGRPAWFETRTCAPSGAQARSSP